MAAPIVVLKNSWAGGEVSPMLWFRNDLQKYPSWSRKLKNMIVHKDGSTSNRPGTYMMAPAKYPDKKVRIRKFEFSTEQAYQLEIGEYYVRFFTVTTETAAAGQIQKYTTWVTGTTYSVGDFVKNGANYYHCNTAHTAGATFAGDSAKWDSTTWLTGTVYAKGEYVVHTNVMYYCDIAHTAGTFADDVTAGKFVAQTLLEIATPYDENDLRWLKFTQSADILFIAHPDIPTKLLYRTSNTNWTFENYPFAGGPFQLANDDPSILIEASAVSGLGVTLTATAKAWATTTAYQIGDYVTESATVYQCQEKHTSGTFATDLAAEKWAEASLVVFQPTHAPNANDGVGALFQLRHYVEGQKVSMTAAGTSTSIACGGTWRVISHGTWTSGFRVEKSTNGGATWTKLRAFTGASDFNVDTYGTEDMSNNAEPFLVRLVVDAVSSGTIGVDLTTDPFYQTGIAQITAYTSGTVVTADVKRTFAATTATDDWTEGSWSDYRGWPSVVEFSTQDRLIFSNSYFEPQTNWMTKIGNYYDFSRGSPLSDSDGITVNLPSREVNGINNLVSLTTLLALTSSSEWSIGDPGTVLTPTSTEQRVNGYEGASEIDAVTIGNRAIFVQAMGGAIRDVGYELSSYSFTGSDLTVMANHFFFGHEIVAMDYQKTPDRLVWAIREDGVLLSMTYLREQEIAAWTQHDTNAGEDFFEDVSVASAYKHSEAWFVVKRGDVRYIERMVKRLASEDPEDQFFVDCGITYDGAAAKVITVGSHLIGKTVSILADGSVCAQQVVDESGQITLDTAAELVHVGIPYISDVETMNVDIQLKDGSSQGRKMKISQFVLGVYKSRGGYIGPTFDEMYMLRGDAITNYDTAVALYSGEIKDTVGGGMEDGARICLRQTDPLPFTVRYICGAITPGGMSNV